MQAEKQLEVLFQISRALVGKQNLDEVLQQIVIRTADLIGSKICSLMLLDDDKRNLIIRATQSLSTAYREKPPIKVGQSVSGQVVETKKVIQVQDVTQDKSYGYPEIARQEGLASLLSVPMMIGEEPIGVLNCYTEETRVFTKNEVQLVRTIANYAAIAIEHMRVVEEETKARTALETRKSFDQAKRILTKKYQMTEEAAHHLIQKMSMDKNKSIGEIASAIVLASDLR